MTERREQRRIERAAGKGTMWQAATMLGSVAYLVEVWQTFHVIKPSFGTGPSDAIPGLMEVRVHLVRHDLEMHKLTMNGTQITLKLEDGRSVDGFISEDEFVASGELKAAEEMPTR